MNAYRWFLVILTLIVGLGNLFFIDFEDTSLMNNLFEYVFMFLMFGMSIFLIGHHFTSKQNRTIN